MEATRIRKGFTLIELMIAVAIVGIISTIALPMYQEYNRKLAIAAGVKELTMMRNEFDIYWQVNATMPSEVLGVTKGAYVEAYVDDERVVNRHYNYGRDRFWFAVQILKSDVDPSYTGNNKGMSLHLGGRIIDGKVHTLCGLWSSSFLGIKEDWLPQGCNEVNVRAKLMAL